jgi:tRNA(Ile)-lysidine synthase
VRNLIKTIQNIAFQKQLWQKGSRIVLGVSGGPDSVCMLEVLAKIAPKYDLELIIAHVNYGLRRKDSERDEEFVRKLAEKHNLEIAVLCPHPALRATFSQKREKGKSLSSENNLREIRYNFFEEVRQENYFDSIAVAHNADDQVETFLMRVIRGAGLQGLSAMKYKTGKIIRPLLGISRKEILDYLKKTNRTYRTDRTNAKNLFFRNKVRNQLVPYLEKNFNPQIRRTISRAVDSIAEDADFLEKIAGEVYRTDKTNRTDQENSLSAKKLMDLHPALQRRIILKAIEKAKKDLKDIDTAHVEEILKALKSTKGKRQTVMFKGLKLTRIGDKVILARNS